jgi:hypothetical protein
MIKRICLIISALLWLLRPSLVSAEAGITVTATDVDVSFPSQAVFTIEAESYVDIIDVRLHYQVDKMNYAEVVSEGWAEFTPADEIEANWVWDMRNASLPPGAKITYWWTIEDAAGNELETSPQALDFDDSRYVWRSLTGTLAGNGQMTLFWYEGSDSFAEELMDTCQEGLSRLTQDIGAYPERPIKIYIYASSGDLLGAMVYSQEWTGGVAFADFSVIAISISPGELDWGKRALVHELTHLVVHQATFGPYGQLPVWLDEGLATYNEGEFDPFLRSSLEEAIAEDELISVRSLCSPFSAYSEKAYLSYAQSYSLAEYLLDSYGQDKMLDLLALLKEGNTYDEALTDVYGFDIEGLDAHWRASLTNLVAVSQKAAVQPALIAGLACLGAGLALWRAVGLKKRVRRRSSGKSAM